MFSSRPRNSERGNTYVGSWRTLSEATLPRGALASYKQPRPPARPLPSKLRFPEREEEKKEKRGQIALKKRRGDLEN